MREDNANPVPSISTFEIEDGTLFECLDGQFPYAVRGISCNAPLLDDGATHIGMVTCGEVRVSDRFGKCELLSGGFFCVQGGLVELMTPLARVLIVTATFYSGLRLFGGPLESQGRLRYVDGCSDTLLISPSRKREPCLNHLHIPTHIPQRWHYHPSDRVGVILGGHGLCHTEDGDLPLSPGMGWQIPAGANHCFETGKKSLDVMAWHPDSDFGPTDENHPMVNRTWLR